MNIRHIKNRLTIMYAVVQDELVYSISYCSFKDQFSRKKGVELCKDKQCSNIVLHHKPNSENKAVALILLNEVMQNNTPRGFSAGMVYVAGKLGFDL